MSDGLSPSAQTGHELGLKVIALARSASDCPDRVHRLFTAGLVLCADNADPHEAFAGFARAVVPAIQGRPGAEKALANLAARVALAGHTCTRDAQGRLTLARWGRSMTFDRVQDAEAWLARVSGKMGA